MVLDELSKRYFKLATKNKKSESPSRITCNCVVCGDKKNRLSLSAVNDEVGVCRCFNAGCTLNDNALPLPAFLKLVDNTLYERYRREKFNRTLGKDAGLNNLLKEEKSNLNNLLEGNPKKEKQKEKQLDIDIPSIFQGLIKLTDSQRAVEYVKGRGISEDIYKNWYFSREKFINILDKNYFVLNSIFIPIIQNNKLSGFYTRGIEEKRFSTILFPNKEKYWSNDFRLGSEQYYIFEGIFDALSSGLDHVIAMLSADLSDDVLFDLIDPVFVLDNDETGKLKALKYVQEGFKVFIWPNDIYEKDMNELLRRMPREDIRNMIEGNIFKGFDAQIKLKMKRI